MSVTTIRPQGLLYALELPLRRPFSTSTGTVTERRLGIVSLTVDGVSGWGEAAPYPGQDERFGTVVDGARTGVLTPTLRAAIDEATSDLEARIDNRRLVDSLPASQSQLAMSIAVGMGDAAVDEVSALVDAGVSRVKVKIAPGHTRHVRPIRDVHPDITLGLDANGSFDSVTSKQLFTLADLDISYLEQPFSDVGHPGVAELHESGFVVLADESVRSVEDASSVLAIPWVSGIVIKPGRLGWRGSLAAVEAARQTGKVWRASGLLETGIGRTFTEALACAGDAFLSDIAPAENFFERDIVPSRSSGATILLASGPGVGVEVDQRVLEEFSTSIVPINESVVPVLG